MRDCCAIMIFLIFVMILHRRNCKKVYITYICYTSINVSITTNTYFAYENENCCPITTDVGNGNLYQAKVESYMVIG